MNTPTRRIFLLFSFFFFPATYLFKNHTNGIELSGGFLFLSVGIFLFYISVYKKELINKIFGDMI